MKIVVYHDMILISADDVIMNKLKIAKSMEIDPKIKHKVIEVIKEFLDTYGSMSDVEFILEIKDSLFSDFTTSTKVTVIRK